MRIYVVAGRAMSLGIFAALAGCVSSADPVAYSGLTSSSYLRPNSRDNALNYPYLYTTQIDWRKYRRVIVEPVTIYRGPDNQFGDMAENDRAALASYMQTQFEQRLRTRYELAQAPDPTAFRVKLTITGAATNKPVIGTLSRFDIAGGAYNGIQAVRGGEGSLTGSILYAVDIYDAQTNRLIYASISKQYPNPYDIAASIGPLDAAMAGVRNGAESLIGQLK
ncbi:DUF3313 domain-containing protein [Bosea sp. LjRoot9]